VVAAERAEDVEAAEGRHAADRAVHHIRVEAEHVHLAHEKKRRNK
jgi:hypothetical protein